MTNDQCSNGRNNCKAGGWFRPSNFEHSIEFRISSFEFHPNVAFAAALTTIAVGARSAGSSSQDIYCRAVHGGADWHYGFSGIQIRSTDTGDFGELVPQKLSAGGGGDRDRGDLFQRTFGELAGGTIFSGNSGFGADSGAGASAALYGVETGGVCSAWDGGDFFEGCSHWG